MYKSELELQKTFKQMLEIDKKNNEVILEEFNARFGNVDLIKLSYSDLSLLTYEQFETLTIYSNAITISFLHKKQKRSLNYLMEKTGYTYDYLKTIIGVLKKNNIIEEISQNSYIINSEFKFPKLHFVSYELKLKNWKNAILQAKKNQLFSYKSYVVMPESIAKKLKDKYKKTFQLYNVGLISVNSDKYKILINCKVNLPKLSCNPSLISSVAKSIINIQNQTNS